MVDDMHPELSAECRQNSCELIELRCVGEPSDGDPFCDGQGTLLIDTEAVDCALDALIEGAPAFLWYEETRDNHSSYAGGLLRIGEGRQGLTQTNHGSDNESYFDAIEVVPLRDAQYFVACKAMMDPYARYTCLKDWASGPAEVTCSLPFMPPFDPEAVRP